MATFTPTQLSVRQPIVNSHIIFTNFLDSDIINKLVHLFANGDIIKYIEDERNAKQLYDPNITIKSFVFGTNNSDSTLLLEINKNSKALLHISIHLVANQLKPENAGLIHFFKNIHKIKKKKNIIHKPLVYALIKVEKPINKPKSLKFSIANGYTTNKRITNAGKYDTELQNEMNVIITVLNRLFDEDNKNFYVGYKNYYVSNTNYYFTPINKLYPIHNQTNNVLQNINNHSKLRTRKNKGTRMLPTLSHDPPIITAKNTRATTRKRNRRNIRNFTTNNKIKEVNI
jgi:hypothetical protein